MQKVSSNNWFVKLFKNDTKTLSFKVIDKKLLKNYTNKIWKKN